MTRDELDRFLHAEFPQIDAHRLAIESVGDGAARVRMPFQDAHLRPGGTISGPSLMMLADTAMYVVVLSRIGPVPLAVTTDLTMHFLRRARPTDVIADARLLKLGKRLAVGEVALRSDGQTEPIAHAVLTYSLPGGR